MPQHATNARDGKGFACAAIVFLISRTSGESPLSMPRCRALEIEKSVVKKRRAAFSFSGLTLMIVGFVCYAMLGKLEEIHGFVEVEDENEKLD